MDDKEFHPRKAAHKLGVSRNALRRNDADRSFSATEIATLNADPPAWLTAERDAAAKRKAAETLPRIWRRNVPVTFACGHEKVEELRLHATRTEFADAVDACQFYAMKEPCAACEQALAEGREPPPVERRYDSAAERQMCEQLDALSDEEFRDLLGHTPLVEPGTDPRAAILTKTCTIDGLTDVDTLNRRALEVLLRELPARLPGLLDDLARLCDRAVLGHLHTEDPGLVVAELIGDVRDATDQLRWLTDDVWRDCMVVFLSELACDEPGTHQDLIGRLTATAEGCVDDNPTVAELLGYVGEEGQLAAIESVSWQLAAACERIPIASLPGGPAVALRLV